jgi:hypothetical protein
MVSYINVMTLRQIIQNYADTNTIRYVSYREYARDLTTKFNLRNTASAIQRLAKLISSMSIPLDPMGITLQSQEATSHNFSGQGDGAIETFTTENPPETLADALSNSQVDLDQWEVDKWIWNHWAGKYQVKVWFKRRDFSAEKTLESLFDYYKDRTPAKYIASPKKEMSLSHSCAIINLYDAHLDKVAALSSTGTTSTIAANINRFETALDMLSLQLQTYNPEVVIYPVGNDLFHTNNFGSNTKKGTPLEYYSDPYETYETIVKVVVDSIDKLESRFPKVQVVMVYGNHDYDKVHTLAVLLTTLYKNNPNVEIVSNRLQRKYLQYGKNLFGFCHGDKEKQKIDKLPLIMATEVSKMWAETTHRKFFCGDLHHGFKYKFHVSQDYPGVTVEFLRSIGCQDTWHVDNGYIGIPKTASAELWWKSGGKSASFEINF